jgi:shikimate kinase
LLKGVNLYLIGMMGCGKTTIGKLLAKKLGYYFFDTDDLIVKASSRSISDIFEKEGEDAFRELETQVLSEISAYKNLVIATGGGIVIRRKNWSYLHHGVILWLDVPVAELYYRLKEDNTRPLLQDPDPLEKLKTIWQSRESLYKQADVRLNINQGETPEMSAQSAIVEIEKILKPKEKGNEHN